MPESIIPILMPRPASDRPPAADHAASALMILCDSLIVCWYRVVYSTTETAVFALSFDSAFPLSLTPTALSATYRLEVIFAPGALARSQVAYAECWVFR